MFFILNNEGMFIAADQAFLEHSDIKSIHLLAEEFRAGNFLFYDNRGEYRFRGNTSAFTKTPIKTVFGDGSLYQVEAQDHIADTEQQPDAVHHDNVSTEPEDDILSQAGAGIAAVGGGIAIKEILDSDTEEEEEEKSDEILLLNEELETPNDHETAKPTPQDQHHDSDEILNLIDEDNEHLDLDIPEKEEHDDSTEDELIGQIDGTAPAPDDHKPVESIPQDQYHDNDEILELIDEDNEHLDPNVPDKEEYSRLTEDEIIDLSKGAAHADEHDDVPISLTEESTTDEADLYDDRSDDELIGLLDDHGSKQAEEVPAHEESPIPTESSLDIANEESGANLDISSAPFADYQSNARLIGITTEDYHAFLEQFAREAKEAESDLRGIDLAAFRDSATSLKDASQLLNLSLLTSDLDEIQNATSDEKESLLDTFFNHIEHIHRDLANDQFGADTDFVDPLADETVSRDDDKQDIEVESTQVPQDVEESKPAELPLNDIEAIPFDFSAKTAADELGLPESLVDEFVSDFVDQARENIPIFHTAHQTGDIETIQKTAHLLKGAASNLRIEPLAETLEALQHNEEMEKVEPLFQKFLGQLKTLENFTGKSTIFKG